MIKNQVVGTSNTQILLAVGGQLLLVMSMFLCNTDGANDDTIDVYVVQNGGSIGVGSRVVASLTIRPTDTEIFNLERLPLEAGDQLVAVCANGTITATVGYIAA